MVRSVDVENAVDFYRRFSLQRDGPLDAIRTEYDFRIALTLQHVALHFRIAHPVAAFAACGVHHDFAREFARSGIKLQRTLLQVERSTNRVQHIAEREMNRGVLRIELKCHTLLSHRDRSRDQCNHYQ